MISDPDQQSLSNEQLSALLDIWMRTQRPWNLQSAIYLLIRKDPEDAANKKRRISFSEKNELEYETRAFTHVLKSANTDPSEIQLIVTANPTATKKEGAVAVDYEIAGNGFASAIIRIGRKILIDLDQLDAWVEVHRLTEPILSLSNSQNLNTEGE